MSSYVVGVTTFKKRVFHRFRSKNTQNVGKSSKSQQKQLNLATSPNVSLIIHNILCAHRKPFLIIFISKFSAFLFKMKIITFFLYCLNQFSVLVLASVT